VNNVADPNATRKDKTFHFLSEMFPSIHPSAIQKVIDALELAEVGVNNDDFDVLACIDQWLNDNPI